MVEMENQQLREHLKIAVEQLKGCAVNHYGNDFELHGMPGFLTDMETLVSKKSWCKALLKPLIMRGYSGDLDEGPKVPPRGRSATVRPTGNVRPSRGGAELGEPPHQGTGAQK